VGERLDRRLVAVMFSDMVGYTALMQADESAALDKRKRYWRALEAHHEAFGGTVVQRLGDGSMSMFSSSLAAVQAAVGIQCELSGQDVPVRLGIHVGEVIVEDERLTGEAVNIAARIESFAIPGGVMLSDSAHDQIKNRSDVSVVALGPVQAEERGASVRALRGERRRSCCPGAGGARGQGRTVRRLSEQLARGGSPLLGRAVDLESLVDLARSHRVVTITEPGGVGKTTVLAELGRMLAPEFLDGVAFVALADVNDPSDVLPALAEALDVKEAEGRTLGEGVITLLGDRQALLLLDNLEQVVAAAPDLASLVDRCPALRVVTTSRTPLRIAGEQEYSLAPLALPPASEITSAESLEAYPSVALFVERATKTKGAFELTPENAEAVAAVCRRLDGLPLALELAAARLRLLSPEALLERLDRALDLLASGRRDVPERQQTLRATIG
jgi:Adenylate and Guanylate cyclase catalytic domain